MNRATLGGVLGAGEVHSRRATESHTEYRGVFAFREADTPAIAGFFESGEIVLYEGPIDRKHNGMEVLVTDVSFDRGLAYFMGKGEPYLVNPDLASGQ